MKVIKRDGRKEKFNSEKIVDAINKSTNNMITLSESTIDNIIDDITKKIFSKGINEIDVEELHELVIYELKNINPKLALNYMTYRDERNKTRQRKSGLIKTIDKLSAEGDNDNANVGANFSAKMLRIGSEASKVSVLSMMPKELSRFHEVGDLYYHDLDSYRLTTNCLHVPIGTMLLNGFNTGYGTLNKPKRITSASELMCIAIQSSQNDMFGGQSNANFEASLAPFVASTREELIEKHEKILHTCSLTDEQLLDVEEDVEEQVYQACQGIVYNLNTMHSRAGSQVPFSSLNIGLPKSKDEALLTKALLEEYEKGLGKGEQPIFPSIIFRVKSGVNRNEGDPYYYLFKLACRVAAKRMNPTFMNIDADFNLDYYNKGYIPATMGCRTYLMSNVNGEPGVEGRGNIAPTTINLVRIGILANHIIDKFFELLDQRLEQCKESLLFRYNILKNLKGKDLPFVIGQHLMKGSENVGPEDSIEPVLRQGTYGIGFIGLAETLVALTGHHHGQTDESRQLGLKIIEFIRSHCDEFTKKEHLNFSCYATPAEGLSGKFIKKDKKQFGIIEGVTDKDYYTNSFHIPVGSPISIFDKLKIEAPYHKLCNGGHISYIEMDDYPDGDTIETIIRTAYDNTNISYIGVNFHIRYCKECGTYVHNESKCPNCGSDNIQGISRVTGYLALDERFGEGKKAERKDRIDHNSTHAHNYDMIVDKE